MDRVFLGGMRDAGTRGRPYVLGCDSPRPSPVFGQAWRSAHTAGWQVVESYRLDAGRRHDPLQCLSVLAVCPGYLQRQVPSVALEVPLCAVGYSECPAGGWRPAISSVGIVLPCDDGPACHLDGELSHPLLGKPPLCHSGRFTEQLLGRPVEFRRGLAQQSSRLSDISTAWTRLV